MPAFNTQLQKDEALDLLYNVINIKTVNPEGKEAVLAEFIASYLYNSGCSIEVEEFSAGRANVTAVLKGRRNGKALLINGHLDTVPFGDRDGWDSPPDFAAVKGGRLYGRGSSDMKSGLCAMLYAFRRLALEGFAPQRDIIFLGTGDEETSGLGAQAAIKSGLLDRVGRIIIAEPTGNKISVASKGTLWLEFQIHGKTSHGAYPWEGINAAEIALQLYSELKTLVRGEKHPHLTEPTCTLTKIQGGVKANMVPDCCTMTSDIRTVPLLDHKRLLASVEQLLKHIEEYTGARLEYKVLTDRKAVEISSEDMLVKDLSESVRAVCGNSPALTGTSFFSDASIFLTLYELPAVLFGPGESSEAHKPNESVLLEKYYEAVEGYYHFLRKQ
ncbi:MAG TPA: M20 family metallopeptidase [Clostridia bacterium]|nr:M20 family metallopeptidase [Clostridia bacterium]